HDNIGFDDDRSFFRSWIESSDSAREQRKIVFRPPKIHHMCWKRHHPDCLEHHPNKKKFFILYYRHYPNVRSDVLFRF
ncbi:hypothetical protein AVEN_208916-1, partial [Araneus ventricosus]